MQLVGQIVDTNGISALGEHDFLAIQYTKAMAELIKTRGSETAEQRQYEEEFHDLASSTEYLHQDMSKMAVQEEKKKKKEGPVSTFYNKVIKPAFPEVRK